MRIPTHHTAQATQPDQSLIGAGPAHTSRSDSAGRRPNNASTSATRSAPQRAGTSQRHGLRFDSTRRKPSARNQAETLETLGANPCMTHLAATQASSPPNTTRNAAGRHTTGKAARSETPAGMHSSAPSPARSRAGAGALRRGSAAPSAKKIPAGGTTGGGMDPAKGDKNAGEGNIQGVIQDLSRCVFVLLYQLTDQINVVDHYLCRYPSRTPVIHALRNTRRFIDIEQPSECHAPTGGINDFARQMSIHAQLNTMFNQV